MHSPCAETFDYTKYDSNATHAFSPIKMILDVYNLPSEVVEVAESPCCQGVCKIAGEEKYYSVAKAASGEKHYGQCCMNPSKSYHIVEKNLTKADNDSPCADIFWLHQV